MTFIIWLFSEICVDLMVFQFWLRRLNYKLKAKSGMGDSFKGGLRPEGLQLGSFPALKVSR